MVLIIQAAVQAALGAIQVLKALGYLDETPAQQAMQIVMNGRVPDEPPSSMKG
jgi:hypothetical protein